MRIALVMLAALTAAAQPLVTPIRDTVYDQSGHVYDGPLDCDALGEIGIGWCRAGIVCSSAPADQGGCVVTRLGAQCGIDASGHCIRPDVGQWGTEDLHDPGEFQPDSTWRHTATDNAPQNPTPSIPALWISTVGAREGYCIKLVSGLPKWAYCGSGSTSTLVGRTWTSLVGTTWTSLIGTTWQ